MAGPCQRATARRVRQGAGQSLPFAYREKHRKGPALLPPALPTPPTRAGWAVWAGHLSWAVWAADCSWAVWAANCSWAAWAGLGGWAGKRGYRMLRECM